MTLYEEHMKIANDIILIRDALIDGKFDDVQDVLVHHYENYVYYNFNNTGNTIMILHENLGSISCYNSFDKNFTYNNNFNHEILINNKRYTIPCTSYTEEMHFQDSLVYDSDVLLGLVINDAFNKNSLPLKYKHCDMYITKNDMLLEWLHEVHDEK